MNQLKNKHIIILLLSLLTTTSCRSKKTFNGTSTLKCAEYDDDVSPKKEKKKSKWQLIVQLKKDGKKVGGKQKKGKSRLFKNKK